MFYKLNDKNHTSIVSKLTNFINSLAYFINRTNQYNQFNDVIH